MWGIRYEMVAIAAMSTPGACLSIPLAVPRLPPFSGKLSSVMPTSDDLPPLKPLADAQPPAEKPPAEIGGREGPEPTRFGDWELRGRCIDF
jgi:Protein of unknown function (DUF1674)